MKRLIFRLSSLGDVILSQALLETPYQGETHWVVAKEYESLLVGHPKIARVWSYDRKTESGLNHWLAFLREIQEEGFDEVIDAHSTLRTHIARIYFSIHSRFYWRSPRWKTVSKERLRRAAYLLLKRALPKSMRPRHLSQRVSLLVGGRRTEKPNFKWLLGDSIHREKRIALIPSSAWRGKEWPTARYLGLVQELRVKFPDTEIALVGMPGDAAVSRLAQELENAALPFANWIGERPLRQVAQLIATCELSVGADTGLLHLSEAVGVPVVTVFGPTRSDFGFGPLHSHSTPVNAPLWCSPCSKDGSLCFRPADRYRCLREIGSPAVFSAVQKTLSRKNDGMEGL